MRFRDLLVTVRFGMLMSEAVVDHGGTVHECRDLLILDRARAMPCRHAARPLLIESVMRHRHSVADELQANSIRDWIWWAISLQALGYFIDIVWHAFMSGGVEPSTVREMARHLVTVHLLLYLGCACVLVATAVALIHRTRETAMAIAFAGAVLSAGAESVARLLPSPARHAPRADRGNSVGSWVRRGDRRYVAIEATRDPREDATRRAMTGRFWKR